MLLCRFAATMLLMAVAAPSAAAEDLLVFAAASLEPALDTLVATPQANAIGNIQISYAASSQLARQIEHGAPAALFVSADQDWMDVLDRRGLIAADSRVDLLGNALVLIAPAASTLTLDLAPGTDLLGALGDDGRLAIAQPDSVPAGRYARAALVSLGLWSSVETRLVAQAHVRAALVVVARGEAPLGIVYRSDALSDPRVRTLATFPAASHPPIVYPAAIVKSADTPAARRLLALLRDEPARAIFESHGFAVLSRPATDAATD